MKRTIRAPSVLLASALVVCAPLVARAAASRATPGFNLFSVEQDIEIGRPQDERVTVVTTSSRSDSRR